jgi:hypothetical protein
MATYEPSNVRLSLYEIFLYVSNATLSIPEVHRHSVLQALAYKLEEWADVSRPELRDVLAQFGEELDEMCIHCNEPLASWDVEEDGEPVCDMCMANTDEPESHTQAEIGACGYYCDGHCQSCDPGYRYGGYDGDNEI